MWRGPGPIGYGHGPIMNPRRGKDARMPAIIDHIGINVTSLAKSKAFYTKALAPLGIELTMEFEGAAGYGAGKAELWLGEGANSFQTPEQLQVITPIHVCLKAKDRQQVDAFYAAAIAAGGRDNGKPGLREIYHPGYYGAFVLDPDGHNVEAVFRS
jgi:catechol 2,3-dioxygenase-like lactoylglutathione lyase family enzyme